MALKPLHDRVLVRREKATKKHQWLIILKVRRKALEGVIVAAGEGARKDSGELIAMSVKGDKILFGKWSEQKWPLLEKNFLSWKKAIF